MGHMNQRVVAIVLVALLAVCFVGSCSVAAVALIGKASEEIADTRRASPRDFAPTSPTSDEPADPGLAIDPIATEPDPNTDTSPEDGDDAAPTTSAFEPLELASAEFAIFHVNKPKVDGWKVTEKLAKGFKLKAWRDEAGEDAQAPYVTHRLLKTDDYAVIEGSTLEQARGLTPAEKDALPGAAQVTVLDLLYPPSQPARLREFSMLVADLAKATGGVLWDEEAQEYLSAAEWKSRRIGGWEKGIPDAPLHFTVFVSTKDKGVQLETGGLQHFGLPELKLEHVPASSRDAAVALLNLSVQLMVEGTVKAEPGTHTLQIEALRHMGRKALVKERVLDGAKLETDLVFTSVGTLARPKLAVTFPGAGAPSARLDAALSELFGSSDRVDQVEHDDALVELSKQQLAIFSSTIKKRFKKGLKPGEVLMVKAPFPTDSGGNEWMWVKVTKLLPDGRIEGFLANDPDDVSDLKSGDEVVVVEDELFDWMLKQKDGTTLGNETGKVMLKRLGR
jgi:uncharacterized protein YegJ (DUF2314 family)